jgi:hypothetical protein
MNNSNHYIDKERLQSLLQFIKEHAANESDFKTLYAKLKEEYNIEWRRLGDREENPYLNNLYQTIGKQANEYLHAKKKYKADVFRLFVDAFEQDVREVIGS